MKKNYKKSRTIYYSNIYEDDFDTTNLERIDIPNNYSYYRKNGIKGLFQDFLYYFLAKPVLSCYCFFKGIRVVNRKQLKLLRKCNQGCFLYGNHVSKTDAFKLQSYIIHRRVNILGYTDALAINKLVSYLVKSFGYLALPNNFNDLKRVKELQEAMKFYVDKKQHILIYPEAHIWPYYTKIRDFKSGSFYYPAKFNKPIMPFVTIFKKVWWKKKPVERIIFGDLIYPKNDLNDKDNRNYLKEKCYQEMLKLSNIYKQYEYIKYIDRNSLQ